MATSTPAQVDEPAALVEQDATPVVLRVDVGEVFDTVGTLDLHESGKVTLAPVAPDWLPTLRNGYLMCWRGREDVPPAAILRELPTRWRNYLWARVAFDHTSDASASAPTAVTIAINADEDPMNRDWLHRPRPTDDIEKTPPPAPLAETR